MTQPWIEFFKTLFVIPASLGIAALIATLTPSLRTRLMGENIDAKTVRNVTVAGAFLLLIGLFGWFALPALL